MKGKGKTKPQKDQRDAPYKKTQQSKPKTKPNPASLKTKSPEENLKEQRQEDKPAQENPKPERKRILLGVSGSVATIKIGEIVKSLTPFVDLKLVSTANALHFFDPKSLEIPVLTDQDEWQVSPLLITSIDPLRKFLK